ncbi:DNA repair protein RAD4 isoform X2 [Phragmites australis]|uniref:DNA repair protein RAD4 isoform X2 n=1 Tax=Phragmites australis TaxID=29695 RepID=UPI002D7765F5|nr:DNA repair protein RAD4 isoform X2 [Phragmites australis]
MRRTRSQSAREGKPTPAGPSAEVATAGANRRRASPAAKGKSPAKVEMGSPLRETCKNGRSKMKSSDGASVKRCSAGSREKNSLEDQTEAIGDTDAAEMDWEEGHVLEHEEGYSHELGETITVEFTDVPSSTNKKSARRPTAEEKELAELVHKVHLLCLIARGRVVDKACSDPLIQASMLSLVPDHLLWNVVDVPKLKAVNLHSLVSWFHRTFCVTAQSTDRGSFKSNLAFALQDRVCALSVALFRALNLTARFVTNLDVAGLKPDTKVMGTFNQDAARLCTRALPSSSPVADCNVVSSTPLLQGNTEDSVGMTEQRGNLGKSKRTSACQRSLCKSLSSVKADHGSTCASASEHKSTSSQFPYTSNNAEVPKRIGDVEFELQLEMALSATATETKNNKLATHVSQSTGSLHNSIPPLKKLRKNAEASNSSSAVWSRNGAPLYWAEIYCGGQASTGSWVHVDVVNDLIDGERNVEASSAVCKKPLRYVVAFAGNGAKDVTRRYCLQWHRIVQGRVNQQWWDDVLAPLMQMELAATNDSEDMELQTRDLTEPLPTSQQAYKDHHLYALEKWLHKNQVLHPKDPVLGFCKGHPVYPRSCVQTLQSRHGWLREGLQVRENELPAKVVTRPKRTFNAQSLQSSANEDDLKPTLELYGEWQLEPLQLPHAVNGIVPKNERGQVDVWSEKCLPPGTVHLRLPRLFQVTKRLGIDYAPAMVGFDYRSGRCLPIFDGIVVCTEFKSTILEAYAEEEEQRQAEERKQEEAQALSRWYQLLCSIVTRQRLNDSYKTPSQGLAREGSPKNANTQKNALSSQRSETETRTGKPQTDQVPNPCLYAPGHEHEFPEEDQIFDEETFVRTKRCPCGFSMQVEEL